MKQLFICLLALLPGTVLAQEPDTTLTPQQIECSGTSMENSLLFIRFAEAGNTDSVRRVLKTWESKCGLTEPVFRAKMVYALKTSALSDSMLKGSVLHYILNYQSRKSFMDNATESQYHEYPVYFGFIEPGSSFDKYTQQISSAVQKSYPEFSQQYLLSEFYSGKTDSLLVKIQRPEYSGTVLARQYYNSVESYLNMAEFHMALVAGIWIPTGEMDVVGNHPEIGFQMGAKRKRLNYDLVMAFKFGKSANYYPARRTKSDNSVELTKDFSGVMVGADLGYDLYAKNHHEIQLAGGIALDGLGPVLEDNDKGLEPEVIWTYNFNIGAAYRYYFANAYYIGIRAKYNIVDYSINNVLDFTGNPVTIQFTLGTLFNVFRNSNLNALKYDYRK